MKSWVMMLGEFEFTSIFFDDEALPPYDVMTYVIFIAFLVLMGIILSNLLVGLAVDDVNQLRLNARLVKLRMQVRASSKCECYNVLTGVCDMSCIRCSCCLWINFKKMIFNR